MILECKVIKVVEVGLHTEFIGEIVDVKAKESVLDENNLPDVEKVKPIVWSVADMSYRKVGMPVADSFSVGKQFNKKANMRKI